MYNLLKNIAQVNRNITLIDEFLLYTSINVSIFLNLSKIDELNRLRVECDSFAIINGDLFFRGHSEMIFVGLELEHVKKDLELAYFIDSKFAVVKQIEDYKYFYLMDLFSNKMLVDSKYFLPRQSNIIIIEKSATSLMIIAEGRENSQTLNRLSFFDVSLGETTLEPSKVFKFDFPNHASVGTRLNEDTHIKRVLGIIQNKLYVSFTDNSLMIIDIEKGEVLKHLGYSDGGKRKRDPINHLVTADFLGGGNVDESKGYLFNLWNSVMYYFDADTEEITQIDLTEELKDKNLDSAVIKYFDDDIIAILDLRAGGVGIIDRHTHKLVWHQTMYCEGKKVRPLELKISGNYMCITDSAEQLHIFERTTALTEEN